MDAASPHTFEAIVAGHICLDILPTLTGGSIAFAPGRSIEAGKALLSTGGPVSNTGLAMHVLGVRTGLIGKVGDDLFGQAESGGNRQRIRAPRNADDQTVRRAQRLQIELDAGIADSGLLVAVDFEFWMVRGDERRHTAIQQIRQDRPRQRRSFRRISARAEFVQDDQGSIIDFAQAVDPRYNLDVFAFLARDIERVCHYFARYVATN